MNGTALTQLGTFKKAWEQQQQQDSGRRVSLPSRYATTCCLVFSVQLGLTVEHKRPHSLLEFLRVWAEEYPDDFITQTKTGSLLPVPADW